MGLAIRTATARDGDALWSVLEPVLRAGDTYALDPDITRDDALSYWMSASHGVFIAEEDEVALGTYYLRRNHGGGGSHVCNCGYVTSPAARGRGLARAMLTHSLETAGAAGFRAMQFNFVVETNRRAIETWQQAGFETVGRLPRAFRHPHAGYVDALVMFRHLV